MKRQLCAESLQRIAEATYMCGGPFSSESKDSAGQLQEEEDELFRLIISNKK